MDDGYRHDNCPEIAFQMAVTGCQLIVLVQVGNFNQRMAVRQRKKRAIVGSNVVQRAAAGQAR